ncbi:MAG: SpoIIE family protein phosphatase [Bacteroidales bacterium]|nr:SpoIIE family protein phosphatase [Bacteroidales bacterium]
METLAITSGAYWYYIIVALLIITAVVGIAIHYRRNREYLRTFHDKENKISELKSKVADLEATIKTESERCAKANHENTSGIRYATRIQSAAFPKKEIGDIFSDYFIFTKPHTIVSGDFYKAVKIKHYNIFVLADCSGHGVPGAFLTMLGLSALKESLAKHFYDDNIDLSAILDEMRQFVKTSLRSTDDSDAPVNDGMNLTLCAFADNDSGIRFAGANQNVYLYSNGSIVAYNGDRMPIGWSFKGDNPFTETLIPAHKGDMLYLTTDSLPSQFGGPDNVKFSTKRLMAMFEEIAALPTEEQKNTITEVVNEWVEGHVQVDDLTVAGVRV